MTLKNESMAERIEKVMNDKRFIFALNYYRRTIHNPYTLSSKIYSLALDVQGEYVRLKRHLREEALRKARANKQKSNFVAARS